MCGQLERVLWAVPSLQRELVFALMYSTLRARLHTAGIGQKSLGGQTGGMSVIIVFKKHKKGNCTFKANVFDLNASGGFHAQHVAKQVQLKCIYLRSSHEEVIHRPAERKQGSPVNPSSRYHQQTQISMLHFNMNSSESKRHTKLMSNEHANSGT